MAGSMGMCPLTISGRQLLATASDDRTFGSGTLPLASRSQLSKVTRTGSGRWARSLWAVASS
jgi:hypothetical protein